MNGNSHWNIHGVALHLLIPDQIFWNLEMLVFEEGEKLESPAKNPQSRDENQQQIQPTYGVNSRIQTRATLVEDKQSHHCTIPTLHLAGADPEGVDWVASHPP